MKRFVNKSRIKQEVKSTSIEDLITHIWGIEKEAASFIEAEPLELDNEKEELTMPYGWY